MAEIDDMLVALTCSSVDVDPDIFDAKAKKWVNQFHDDKTINFNQLTPTIHTLIYHGKDLLLAVPFKSHLGSEENGESIVKHLRFRREHNSPQFSDAAGLHNLFLQQQYGVDREVQLEVEKIVLPTRKASPDVSERVKAFMKTSTRPNTETEGQVVAPDFQFGPMVQNRTMSLLEALNEEFDDLELIVDDEFNPINPDTISRND